MNKEKAFKWFMVGWKYSGEGFNNDYTASDIDGHKLLRGYFEKEWKLRHEREGK